MLVSLFLNAIVLLSFFQTLDLFVFLTAGTITQSASQTAHTIQTTHQDASSSIPTIHSLSSARAPVATATQLGLSQSETTLSQTQIPDNIINIPIILVSFHDVDVDVVISEHASMSCLSYHGDLSELAKEPEHSTSVREKMMRSMVKFDTKELLNPDMVPEFLWTKKCRPAHAMPSVQQRAADIGEMFSSPERAHDVEELGRLAFAVMKPQSDEQQQKDKEALGELMKRLCRDIEERGCSKKEASMIGIQILKSVGEGLARKAEQEEQ